MSTIDPRLLSEDASVPPDDALLGADPTGAWGALVRLRAEATATAPAAPPVPDSGALARWSADPDDDDDAVPYYAVRSLLLAELLEGAIDELPAAGPRHLAAAPARAAVDPWPARYRGGGWTVVLGVDEAGWLYYALEAVPEGAPDTGELRLDDLALTVPTALRAGAAGGLGDADELLGGDDVNPVRAVHLAGQTLPRDGA